MRRLDDILLQYGRAVTAGQLLLLRELGNVPLSFDHPRVLSFLRHQAREEDPWLSYVAHVEIHRAGPVAIARDFGLRLTSGGFRSSHHLDRPPAVRPAIDETHRTRLVASFTGPLGDLMDALCDQVALKTEAAPEALLCLGALHTKGSIERLSALCETPHLGPRALIALAASNSRRARSAANTLLAGLAQPDGLSVATLRFLPLEPHAGLVQGLPFGDDRDLGAAIGAQGHEGPAGLDVVGRLLTSAEAWVRAHALLSLAAQGQGLELARNTYLQETEPLLKTLAIRAIAACDAREARLLLLELCPTATQALQAVILEELARAQEADVAAAATALAKRGLTSTFAPLRASAIGLLVRGDDPVAEQLAELLAADDPVLRMEGAHCLRHLPGPPAAQKLGAMVLDERSIRVALTAIASLARFPAELAMPPLLAALTSPEEAVCLMALRALSELEGSDAREIVARASATLGGDTRVPVRSALLELAGKLAARTGDASLLDGVQQVLMGTDRDLLPAALDAQILSGLPPTGDLLARLRPLIIPEVAARLALVRWLGGDVAAPAELAALVRGSGAMPAIRTALQIFALLPYLGLSRQFEPLEHGLLAQRPADDEAPSRAVSGVFRAVSSTASPAGEGLSAEPGALSQPPLADARRRGAGRRPASSIVTSLLEWSSNRTAQIAVWPGPLRNSILVFTVLAAAGLLHLALRSPAPSAQPAAGRPSAVAPARLAGLRVERVVEIGTGEEAHPASGEPLPVGQSFKTRGLLELGTSYPATRVVVHPGGGRLDLLVRQPAPSFGYRLEMTLDEGVYRIETRLGATQAAFRLPWGTLRCTMANLDLVVLQDRGRIALDCGQAEIESPAGAQHALQGPARWDGP